jgi:hypothetical protein
MTATCQFFPSLMWCRTPIVAALPILAALATTDAALAQNRPSLTMHDLRGGQLGSSEVPTISKRGSQFPRLSGSLTATSDQYALSNALGGVQTLKMLQLKECFWPPNNENNIKCDSADKGAGLELPILLVGTTLSSLPPGIVLHPPEGAKSEKIPLSRYIVEGAETFWVRLAVDSALLRTQSALVVCQKPCDEKKQLLNLADQQGALPPSRLANDKSVQGAAAPTQITPLLPNPTLRPTIDSSLSSPAASTPASSPKGGAAPPATKPNPTLPGISAAPQTAPGVKPDTPLAANSAPNPAPAAAPRPPNPVPQPKAASAPSKSDQVEVAVSIDGVPGAYDDKKLKRLLLSAMEGAAPASSVSEIKLRPPGPADNVATRSATITIKSDLKDSLKVATQPIDCSADPCRVRVALKPWVLDANTLPAGEIPQFASGIILQSGNSWIAEFERLRINGEYLPATSLPGQPPRRYLVYLLDGSRLRVNLPKVVNQKNDDHLTRIVLPDALSSRGLRLRPLPGSSRFELVQADDVLDAPVASEPNPQPQPGVSPPPPVTAPPVPAAARAAQAHLILKPVAPQNWTVERAALRLLTLLEAARQRPFSAGANGARTFSKVEKLELTKSRDAVVVWSADAAATVNEPGYDQAVPGISFGPVPARAGERAPQNLVDQQRINQDDLVYVKTVNIVRAFMYDTWIIQVEPFVKIYNDERPDTSNNECEFSVVSVREGASERIPLSPSSQGAKRVLRSAPIESAKWASLDQTFQFVVHPTSGSANCAESSATIDNLVVSEEPSTSSPSSRDRLVGVAGKRAPLKTRGRWLLGLYAPQDIGVNASSSSGSAVDNAKEEIFRSFTSYLDKARDQFYPNGDVMNSAVGYDFAAANSAEPSAPGFPESAVFTGQYRNPKISSASFRLDREGERRYLSFLEGSGTQPAPSFAAIGKLVERYSRLFEVSDERSSIVLYVGTTTPTTMSCQDWKAMSQSVASLSGKPRIFGIMFVGVGSARIQADLGPNKQEELLAVRTRAYSCEGANKSAVLFVPFSDLLSREPATVLDAAFDKINTWLAQVNN